MKKNYWMLLGIMILAVMTLTLTACGGGDEDTDDELIGSPSSSKAKVSLNISRSRTSYTDHYGKTTYTYSATVTVSGVQGSDVIVLGVRAEPVSSSGYQPGRYFEAGSRSTVGTCNVILEAGTTYYLYGYANINGTRVDGEKQTFRVR